MKLWLRPTFKTNPDGTEERLSIALCRTSGPLLVDEDICVHFEEPHTGPEMRSVAKEFYDATEVEWGTAIDVTERPRQPV